MEAKYGTFLKQTFLDLSENQQGFRWRRRMQEVGCATDDQVAKGYERIPCNPDSAHTLFLSPRNTRGATNPANIMLRDGTRVSLNKHLGNLLMEYIGLLVEALRLHNILITNSTFPLLTARPGDNWSSIQARIRQRLEDSHTLQAQMRICKGALKSNRAQFTTLGCYSEGPTQ